MQILKVMNAKSEETNNTADTETTQAYDPNLDYDYGDEVLYNDYIFFSLSTNNRGNQPDTNPLYWVKERIRNEKAIYDIYPQTFSVAENGDLELEYDVANIDTIFLGNIHGEDVEVTAGAIYTKHIGTGASPLAIWNSSSEFDNIDDFFIQLSAPFTGTLKIKITMSTSTNKSALGFVNYGVLEDLGCTLLPATKYNVRSVRINNKLQTGYTAGNATYQEIILSVVIDKHSQDTKEIIKKLTKYRGVPLLIVGDDEGKREEMMFYGIFYNISFQFGETNRYKITLTSLRYDSFVPPTEIEEALRKYREQAKAKEKNDDSENPSDSYNKKMYQAVRYTTNNPPSVDEFDCGTKVIYDENNPCNKWMVKNGKVEEVAGRVDAMYGTPSANDFTKGCGKKIIFDLSTSACRAYYVDSSGDIKLCRGVVNTSTGATPSADDFYGDIQVVFAGGRWYSGGAGGGASPVCDEVILLPGKPSMSDNCDGIGGNVKLVVTREIGGKRYWGCGVKTVVVSHNPYEEKYYDCEGNEVSAPSTSAITRLRYTVDWVDDLDNPPKHLWDKEKGKIVLGLRSSTDNQLHFYNNKKEIKFGGIGVKNGTPTDEDFKKWSMVLDSNEHSHHLWLYTSPSNKFEIPLKSHKHKYYDRDTTDTADYTRLRYTDKAI